jgi:hypothetical protein
VAIPSWAWKFPGGGPHFDIFFARSWSLTGVGTTKYGVGDPSERGGNSWLCFPATVWFLVGASPYRPRKGVSPPLNPKSVPNHGDPCWFVIGYRLYELAVE